ncbi:TetR/AcrR family transcriptional regulator [Alicyclobacillus acidoterrestris]|uniref:TetR/AcrR family transcriptional regulator n=1 Tax=Alicyclobacillus TaxID=29330 RepID=UPI0011945525|nr:TetR/AcrR family transcriptional regulator [Alicyclobacillus suci]GEO27833.1 TetR family transcriptional regulator [Alicyclobacillus acidoterrestris]
MDSARSLITDALIMLLSVSTFEKITVQKIVKKAGVSRSTFYLHFNDKFDLLNQVTEHIVEELGDFFRKTSWERVEPSTRVWLFKHNKSLCEHVYHYRHFYRYRLKDIEFTSHLTNTLTNWLNLYFNDEQATFAAWGTIGLIRNWIEKSDPVDSLETAAFKLTNIAFYLISNVDSKIYRQSSDACLSPSGLS